MIDVRVVPTGPLLAPIFAALHRHAFAQPWSTDAFTATLAGPGTVTVVATAANNPSEEASPVGFAIARLAGPEAEILTLAVDPAHRRRGIGRRLVTALFEAARAAGARPRPRLACSWYRTGPMVPYGTVRVLYTYWLSARASLVA